MQFFDRIRENQGLFAESLDDFLVEFNRSAQVVYSLVQK